MLVTITLNTYKAPGSRSCKPSAHSRGSCGKVDTTHTTHTHNYTHSHIHSNTTHTHILDNSCTHVDLITVQQSQCSALVMHITQHNQCWPQFTLGVSTTFSTAYTAQHTQTASHSLRTQHSGHCTAIHSNILTYQLLGSHTVDNFAFGEVQIATNDKQVTSTQITP